MALSGIQLSAGVLVGVNKSIDAKYGPYPDVATAKSDIGVTLRYLGLTVGIITGGVVEEYWWESGTANDDLVVKGGGGGGTWGSITGTLSSQTDLQSALDAKFDDPTGTTSQYIRGDGSLSTLPVVLDTILTGFIPTQGVVTDTDTLLLGLEKIAANALDVSSTGVYVFGGITLASTTTFNVGIAEGFIVDNTTNLSNPSVIKVTYAGATGLTDPNLTTSTETYILLNSSGVLVLQPTPPTPQQRRQNIFLGKLGHADRLTLINAFSQPDLIQSPLSQLRDVWTPINLINGGVYPSPNGANLSFNTSAGTIYGLGINFSVNRQSPSTFNVPAQIPTTFRYRTQTGGAGGNVTVIDPTNYDLAGTITSISGTGGRATNQRIYCVQNGVIRVQYGQTIYNSLTDAIQGIQTEVFVTFPNFTDNAVLIGILSLTKNATDLTDTGKARILLVSKFGETIGSAGGVSTSTLQQAYNNSIIPNILTNATLGGMSIKRGSSADTDNILYGQNGAGTTTMSITGNGDLTANSFIKTGGLSTDFLKANGTVDSTTYQPTITGAATTITTSNLTASRVLVSDASGKVAANTVTTTTLGYLDATSSIQTQLNGKQATLTNPVTGTGTTNSLPKFTGASTLGDSSVIQLTNNDLTINGLNIGRGNSSIITNNIYGLNAGNAITTGSNNVFFGDISGQNNTTGDANTFIGSRSGNANISGNFNSFLGSSTGRNITTGLNNVFLGDSSGRFLSNGSTILTTANNSIFLGANTKSFADNQTNQIIIGNETIGLGTNTTIIGTSSTTHAAIYGNLLLGTTTNSGFKLDVTGTGRFTSTLQATNIGIGTAANLSSYLNVIANTTSVAQLYLPPSAVDYTGTVAGMLWNNTNEWKFYDSTLSTVNRFLKLNGNTALVNSNPLNVVTSTGVGGNLGTLKAEVAFSRYPTAVTYTILLTDVGFGWVVAVTDTSAARTINLPVANTVPAGWQTTIKDESGGALLNSITVSRSSTDTIEGATSRTINTNYGVLKLYSDGVSKWFLI